jgi:hypothetical protein
MNLMTCIFMTQAQAWFFNEDEELLQNRVSTILFFLLLIFIQIQGNDAYSQNHFLLSAGISAKWSFNQGKLENAGEDKVVTDGNTGSYVSFGVCWFDDPDFNLVSRITYENTKSQMQDWERKDIGSINANIFRIDPFMVHGRIKKSKFLYNFNIAGISIYKGKGTLLSGSYCYDAGSWYLIRNLHVNTSLGWSLIGGGIDYEIARHILAGIETVMIEEDGTKVTFLTNVGDINSKVTCVNSFFPMKFKITVKL